MQGKAGEEDRSGDIPPIKLSGDISQTNTADQFGEADQFDGNEILDELQEVRDICESQNSKLEELRKMVAELSDNSSSKQVHLVLIAILVVLQAWLHFFCT